MGFFYILTHLNNPQNIITMKHINFFALGLLALTFLACNTEELSIDNSETNSNNPNFRISESNFTLAARASTSDPCMVTNLIAGQHYTAGRVEVGSDGVDLSVTYFTDPGWTISETHMSIGNCDEQSIPTTGSGNPKIGHFEQSSSHSTGVNVVTYYIDLSVLDNNYCFAAHAKVQGPSGNESAWAEGPSFSGNSWAMFVEALLTDCNVDDSGNNKD
jgi:hypothetical protein